MIEIAVSLKGTGWVGFGPTSTGTMLLSDVGVGWVDQNGVPTVQDRWITERSGACPGVCVDVQIGGIDDIGTNFNGSIVNGVTQLKWRRLLDTKDTKSDIAIVPGPMQVIFAWHPTTGGPSIPQHLGNTRGIATIDFFAGTANVANVEDKRKAHGSLMFIAWALLIPVAAWIGRYLKSHPWWFNAHRLLNTTAILLTIVGFIIAVDFSITHFDTVHKIIGLIVVILGISQPVIGTVADKWFNPDRKRIPAFPDISHWVIGWVTICIALANIQIGLDAYGNATGLFIASILLSCLTFLLFSGYAIFVKVTGGSRH